MARSKLQVRDLMDLAVIDGTDPSELLATVYAWKYDHALGRAKAAAGAGSAVVLATILPLIQSSKDSSVNWVGLSITLASAAILLTIGITLYYRARRVQIEFIKAESLLAELIEVKPFLRLIRAGAR